MNTIGYGGVRLTNWTCATCGVVVPGGGGGGGQGGHSGAATYKCPFCGMLVGYGHNHVCGGTPTHALVGSLSLRPWRCPICDGCGTVPHDFYYQHGTSATTGRETCRACRGTGIVRA